jgi:hypothetical protein
MFDTSVDDLLRLVSRMFFLVCGGTLVLIAAVVVLAFVEM